MIEITQHYTNPARTEPPSEELPIIVEFVAVGDEPIEEPVVQGVPPTLPSGGSFRFVQEDELEAEAQQPTESASWPEQANEQPAEVEITETITEVNINGHAVIEDTVTITTTQEVHLRTALKGITC